MSTLEERVGNLERYVDALCVDVTPAQRQALQRAQTAPLADLERLRKAWQGEGVNPKYHRWTKAHLFALWPELAQAVERLVGP